MAFIQKKNEKKKKKKPSVLPVAGPTVAITGFYKNRTILYLTHPFITDCHRII